LQCVVIVEWFRISYGWNCEFDAPALVLGQVPIAGHVISLACTPTGIIVVRPVTANDIATVKLVPIAVGRCRGLRRGGLVGYRGDCCDRRSRRALRVRNVLLRHCNRVRVHSRVTHVPQAQHGDECYSNSSKHYFAEQFRSILTAYGRVVKLTSTR
jgi:hypothetical protein